MSLMIQITDKLGLKFLRIVLRTELHLVIRESEKYQIDQVRFDGFGLLCFITTYMLKLTHLQMVLLKYGELR